MTSPCVPVYNNQTPVWLKQLTTTQVLLSQVTITQVLPVLLTITTPVNCSVDDTAVTNKVTILLSTGLLIIPTGQDTTGQDTDWSRYRLVKIP